MNILLLGPLKQKTAKGYRIEPMINFFKKRKFKVIQFNKKISINFIKSNAIDMIISNGYPYRINSDVINVMKGKLVNLHTSFLPYGRGIGGLLFCIIKNQPTGVSLHFIDENYDTGKIIKQKIINPKYNETYREFYLRLLDEVNKLFFNEFENIKSPKISGTIQKKIANNEQYNRSRSEIVYEFFENTYDIKIRDLKRFSESYIENEKFFEKLSFFTDS